LIHQKRKDT